MARSGILKQYWCASTIDYDKYFLVVPTCMIFFRRFEEDQCLNMFEYLIYFSSNAFMNSLGNLRKRSAQLDEFLGEAAKPNRMSSFCCKRSEARMKDATNGALLAILLGARSY